jgi:hypothetical protein
VAHRYPRRARRSSGCLAQAVSPRRLIPRIRVATYITVWEDVESIQAFAGERWQEAVITPDEEHLLKGTWIEHYEAIDTSG